MSIFLVQAFLELVFELCFGSIWLKARDMPSDAEIFTIFKFRLKVARHLGH